MRPEIIYALISASCAAFVTILYSSASRHISSSLGATIISGSAVIVGLLFVLPGLRSGSLEWSGRGLVLVTLAGACAFALDYFALKAYGTGLSVSIGGPIMIGGSIALVTVIGLVLGEPASLLKIIAILLIGIGASILGSLPSQ